MITIGLEKEFFLLDEDNNPHIAPVGFPRDDCQFLAEARSAPYSQVHEAVFSLKAEQFRMEKMLKNPFYQTEGLLHLSDEPLCKIPKSLAVKSLRIMGKGAIEYQNFYGYDTHNNKNDEATAGVHVSFCNYVTLTRSAYNAEGHPEKFEIKYSKMFDWPSIFTELDSAFKDEIKKAKRNPGFYEIKSDGRVEYRSLPSNVDLYKLVEVLEPLIKS